MTLKEDSQAIEEVVVVGYGTQKKVNLVGAVAAVNIDEKISSRSISNGDDANPRSAAQCRSGAPAAICAGVDCNVTTAPHPARASARSSARSA